MAGSIFGNTFTCTTWGESHGKAIGVVVDGVPAGIPLDENDIQIYLNRRKPGGNKFSTPRKEDDMVEILSGVFEGKTTGTPISLSVPNTSQNSKDYTEIASYYRPGHADYTLTEKFGFRDYRGGGRSSGRETIGRVAAGAIAIKLLSELGIDICAYTKSIGPVEIDPSRFSREAILTTPTSMPDVEASQEAERYLEDCLSTHDSSGGVIECRVNNLPVGLGEPVFDKLNAVLFHAVGSIGGVKAIEFGDGKEVAYKKGSEINDAFTMIDGKVTKKTNHSGGILGGISDGSELLLRAYFKPTPSIFKEQETVNQQGDDIKVNIKGRHDPIIVPRAVVVVESMVALTLVDLLFQNMSSKIDHIKKLYDR